MTRQAARWTAGILLSAALALGGNAQGQGAATSATATQAFTPPPVTPALDPATPMTIPDQYTIERNIAYDKYPATILDVSFPKEKIEGKRPGVVMFHGGGWIHAGGAGKESMKTGFVIPYLEHGFVVCNVEYRVAHQGIAPAAVIDARNAAKWFYDHADQYNVDVNRLVVTGASAGGHLCLTTGMIPASEADLGPAVKFAAICNGFGITDIPAVLKYQKNGGWAHDWLPDGMPGRDELAKRLSPITYVRKDLPPILTFQGDKDTAVPFEQGLKLTEALKAAGADAEEYVLVGAGHGPKPGGWPDVNEHVFAFLKKHGIIQ